MSVNPYRDWLGRKADDRPDHYALLGLSRYESDPQVIERARDETYEKVNLYSSGVHIYTASRVLGEIAAAATCLLDSAKKRQYDDDLRSQETHSDVAPLAAHDTSAENFAGLQTPARKKAVKRATAIKVASALDESTASIQARLDAAETRHDAAATKHDAARTKHDVVAKTLDAQATDAGFGPVEASDDVLARAAASATDAVSGKLHTAPLAPQAGAGSTGSASPVLPVTGEQRMILMGAAIGGAVVLGIVAVVSAIGFLLFGGSDEAPTDLAHATNSAQSGDLETDANSGSASALESNQSSIENSGTSNGDSSLSPVTSENGNRTSGTATNGEDRGDPDSVSSVDPNSGTTIGSTSDSDTADSTDSVSGSNASNPMSNSDDGDDDPNNSNGSTVGSPAGKSPVSKPKSGDGTSQDVAETPLPEVETQPDGLRTWTSLDGQFKVEAVMTDVDNEIVKLRRLNGETLDVPIVRLSQPDQQFAAKALALRNTEAISNLIDRGAELIDSEEYDEAAAQFVLAGRIESDDIRPDFCLGLLAALVDGDMKKAKGHFVRCSTRTPDNPTVLNNLALTEIRSGDIGGAITHLVRALKIDPSNEDVIHNLEVVHGLLRFNRIAAPSRLLKTFADESIDINTSGGFKYSEDVETEAVLVDVDVFAEQVGGSDSPLVPQATIAAAAGGTLALNYFDTRCLACSGTPDKDCPNRKCRRGRVGQPTRVVVGRSQAGPVYATKMVYFPCPDCRGGGLATCQICDGVGEDPAF